MRRAKIIGGSLKGRVILLPETFETRPTKSIARESIFDALRGEIEGLAFVEVFAGSGSVGLEAISRGASEAIFIERDRAAFKVLEQNIAALKIANAKLFCGDAFVLMASALDRLKSAGKKAWFYFDPPFSIREGFSDIYAKTEAAIASLDPALTAGVIVEHGSNTPLNDRLGSLAIAKRRKFGKTTLSYYLLER
ncbi:MAG: 16S rRNA (guanine(966)-N(2))-methyltransferase RsmD [Helicobacteraceae bacterium]|jgi:16S rRNA (guanine(966)-N(2))-methyltransferase RsmD|nr:16S rRNA (guanine(966)-N(2))-methyltransferase RsmD [Helicobacteraceae bacterium]